MVKQESFVQDKVVIKVGSSVLCDRNGLKEDAIKSVCDQVAELVKCGVKVVLVSSGAVACGSGTKTSKKNNLQRRNTLAALGQAELFSRYASLFKDRGVVVSLNLLSRGDLNQRSEYLSVRESLNELLDAGVVPFVNGNDATFSTQLLDKIYDSNDTLAAMVANALGAKLLILLGLTDGLYTADPNYDKSAKFIPLVEDIGAVEAYAKGSSKDGIGSGGMASKIAAAKIATSSGISMAIASSESENILLELCKDNRSFGTWFPSKSTRLEAKKRWIYTGVAEKRGDIVVDDGAANALKTKRASLLPAGIVGVKGQFNKGDLVGINTLKGEVIGFGLSNYSANKLSEIRGKNTKKVMEMLNDPSVATEAIHLDSLALV